MPVTLAAYRRAQGIGQAVRGANGTAHRVAPRTLDQFPLGRQRLMEPVNAALPSSCSEVRSALEALAGERIMAIAEFTFPEIDNRPTCRYAEVEGFVLAAQAGDPEAFETLFETFRPAVRAVVRAVIHDETEAQEAVQEIFIQAFRKIDQLTEPARFPGWIRTIAGRMAINRVVRDHRRRMFSGDFLETEADDFESPLGQVLADERRKAVRQGMDRLGKLDRDTLEAFYFEGQSLVEMSRRFDSPVGTIKRRLHVARKRLARELEPIFAS